MCKRFAGEKHEGLHEYIQRMWIVVQVLLGLVLGRLGHVAQNVQNLLLARFRSNRVFQLSRTGSRWILAHLVLLVLLVLEANNRLLWQERFKVCTKAIPITQKILLQPIFICEIHFVESFEIIFDRVK